MADERGFYYLASPYDGHPDGHEVAFAEVSRHAGLLLCNGIYVFCPISHTHPIAVQNELPRGWDFWHSYDVVMVGAARGLIVCCLKGWKRSMGVQGEIRLAQESGKPIWYWTPPDEGIVNRVREGRHDG